MQKSCFPASEPSKDHRRFWLPSVETYWNGKNIDDNHSGFPLFLAFLYRSVNQGEQGEEDPSHILDNILYQYPNNVPTRLLQAFIGGIVSFMTFSRLNLNSILSSFSWSQSHIAIETIELSDGNFIVFALKIPTFFSQNSVKSAINRAITSLKLRNESLNKKISTTEALSLVQFFNSNSYLIINTVFPSRTDDPFDFSAHPFSSSAPKSVTCLATELFVFARGVSPCVIGSAIFSKTEFILSEIQNPLLNLLPIFGSIAQQMPGHEISKFDTIDIWANPSINGWSTENRLIPMSLSIISWGSVNYYVLIKKEGDISSILESLHKLLSNGMSDFAVECENPIKEKIEGSPAAIIWPDTSSSRMSACDISTLQRMSNIHDQFVSYPMLRELSVLSQQKYITGIMLPKIEIIVETKPESSGKPFINDAYSRMKELLPNLPSDLLNL